MTPRNIPEERRSNQNRGGSLKSKFVIQLRARMIVYGWYNIRQIICAIRNYLTYRKTLLLIQDIKSLHQISKPLIQRRNTCFRIQSPFLFIGWCPYRIFLQCLKAWIISISPVILLVRSDITLFNSLPSTVLEGSIASEGTMAKRPLRTDVMSVTTDGICCTSGRMHSGWLWQQIPSESVPAIHIVAKRKLSSVEAADVISAWYVSFILVISNTHLL
jgi:hypothetical protein